MRFPPFALLLAASLPAMAQPTLLATRITPPAQLLRDDRGTALLPRAAVNGGDLIRTGARGSASLQLAGDSVVTLGDSGELFVHSMEPASRGRGPLLRLQLLRGDLQLEAYPPSNAPPHDYRINLGPLQLRALGADLWAYANPLGEGVCLHQGAVEITGAAGAQRLDVAGDCVQRDAASGKLQLLEQAETRIKDSLLNAEPDDAAVAVAAAPTARVAATAPTAAHGNGRWTVVLASLPDRASAEQTARKLKDKGLRVTVVEVTRPPAFRVVSGDYGKRKDAAHAAAQLRRQHHQQSAWVAQQP